jgi:hypothetical protein
LTEKYDLNVYITHFVPPKTTALNQIKSFFAPRFSYAYLRSWARLLKHGTRGNQPWKKDVMTKSRSADQINRMIYLSRILQSLSSIRVKSLTVNIVTNSEDSSQQIAAMGFNLKLNFHIFPQYNKMNHLNNSPWNEDDPTSPWNLVWEHKKLLSDDFLKGNVDSLYLYMENDILFTQQNLEYWLNESPSLNELQLSPSFLRVEFDHENSEWIAIDVFDDSKINIDNCPKICHDNFYFMQISNSYSGLYLLDQNQLQIHLKSKAFSKLESRELIWWDLGARATSGNQFLSVPDGFSSRNVIKVDKETLVPSKECFIHHLPNLYARTFKLRNPRFEQEIFST